MVSALARIPERRWEGLAVKTKQGRFIATALCACGETRDWTAKSMPAPETVIVKFKQFGWDFHHHKPVCLKCRTAPKQKVEPMPETTPAADAAKPTPSDAAKVLRRYVYVAIEDAYDEANRRYKVGHSDAAIAKAVTAPEQLVRNIREEFFGPAAPPEPPEITNLRADLDTLVGNMARTAETAQREHADALALKVRFDGICKAQGWA